MNESELEIVNQTTETRTERKQEEIEQAATSAEEAETKETRPLPTDTDTGHLGTNGDAVGRVVRKAKTAFAKAAEFARAIAAGPKGKAEDIYAWEHGVAVEPWPEPVNGKELLDALVRTLQLFVLLPKWGAETLALWILHTYAYQLRDVTTYIGIESPEKRCGKTTLLGVVCELVNRPVVASNISSPAFYRVIEEKEPTLMIDEADAILHGNYQLRGILNSGYTKEHSLCRASAEPEEREQGSRR